MVTRGREFPNSKSAGRNESEPMSRLVNELEKPTLWSIGEGRGIRAGITEVAHIDSRGSSGLASENVILNSFIVTPTRFGKLNWGKTIHELEDMHVLFMEDQRDTYLASIVRRMAA